MSLSRLTSRLLQALPKPLPAPKPPPPPPAPKPEPQARFTDSFTPSRPRSPSQPELNPPQLKGYSEPVKPEDLPPPGNGTGVLTLNLANGKDDYYRTDENRTDQADLIRETGASIVALQEVDVGVGRSGGVNTGLEVVRKLEPAFDAFVPPNAVEPVPISDPNPPEVAIREGQDGTTLYQTPQGTLVTGESFSGDDRGGLGTRSSEATYGNAVYVAPPNRVTDAYTVVLPSTPDGLQRGVTPPDLAALADGQVTDAERDALRTYNETVRHDAPEEPRTALVTRVVGPDGKEQTLINVHLDASNEAIREEQLKYLAQIVEAEKNGSPPRDVLVMGDFNDSTAAVGEHLEDAGLHRVVGGSNDGIENFDQVWVSSGVETDHSAQVDTGGSALGNLLDAFKGVSDHPNAGYTVIR